MLLEDNYLDKKQPILGKLVKKKPPEIGENENLVGKNPPDLGE